MMNFSSSSDEREEAYSSSLCVGLLTLIDKLFTTQVILDTFMLDTVALRAVGAGVANFREALRAG